VGGREGERWGGRSTSTTPGTRRLPRPPVQAETRSLSEMFCWEGEHYIKCVIILIQYNIFVIYNHDREMPPVQAETRSISEMLCWEGEHYIKHGLILIQYNICIIYNHDRERPPVQAETRSLSEMFCCEGEHYIKHAITQYIHHL
jgi:hypothetical protein